MQKSVPYKNTFHKGKLNFLNFGMSSTRSSQIGNEFVGKFIVFKMNFKLPLDEIIFFVNCFSFKIFIYESSL